MDSRYNSSLLLVGNWAEDLQSVKRKLSEEEDDDGSMVDTEDDHGIGRDVH